MQSPCFGGKESLRVQTLPDGFRDNERCALGESVVSSQNLLCSFKQKQGYWRLLNVLTIECMSIHQKNMCPHEPVNTICGCSSFNFTLAWVFQNPLPHPDIPHANKIPLNGVGYILPSDYCYSGAGQFPLRSNAEFSCRCFSPVKTSRSVCFLYGGRGCEKIEEPHWIAQASWAISNSEWKEIMNQIIGNGSRATKMTS